MLPKCDACHGLVPLGEAACPNCLVARDGAQDGPRASAARTAKKVGVGVLGCIAGAGVSLTLMACYGGPAMIGPVEVPPASASAPAPDASETSAPLADPTATPQ